MKKFTEYLESLGQSKRTIEVHQTELFYYLNYCEDQGIEAEESTFGDIITYVKHLQQRGLKQITIKHYINSLKHYFNWVVKRQLRQDNPTGNIEIRGVKRRQLHDIIKRPELEAIYESYQTPEKAHTILSVLGAKRNKAMLGLMIWQGLGSSELGRLTVKDIKLREGKIYVPGDRKSNERELRLEPEQIIDLMQYTLQSREKLLEITKSQSDHLFISTSGNNSLNNTINRLIQKLQAINGRIKNAKQIRASVIVHWLKHYNLREVQYMAGHRYVSSTENFLINDVDDLSEDIIKFHPLG